jgi:OmpA-OmpF porin, OOP family
MRLFAPTIHLILQRQPAIAFASTRPRPFLRVQTIDAELAQSSRARLEIATRALRSELAVPLCLVGNLPEGSTPIGADSCTHCEHCTFDEYFPASSCDRRQFFSLECTLSALTGALTLVRNAPTGAALLPRGAQFNKGFFMKSKLVLLGTVAALSVVAASQSEARNNQGWYVGIEGGANWVDDNDGFVAFSSGLFTVPDSISFDTGWSVLATVGYGFDQHWRLELEGGYRSNDVDLITAASGFYTSSSGDLTQISLMANVLFDVPLTDRLDFTVGAGAGAVYAEFDGPFASGDDSDVNFAYQGIAGLSYAITDRLDLTLTYRYLHVNDPEFTVSRPFTSDRYTFDDVENHTVSIGLRYDLFDEPAPMAPMTPPPPPPPPVEASQFIIYFGFNKCNITNEADQVLDEAAEVAKATGSATVQIVGHTDTVGSTSYNQKLSNCRADATKSNLVGKGVSASSISASGRGETELLVKTGDNVKEPQNRRATIDVNN